MPADATAARTMHIGELADRTGLSLRTIRHYDEVGLLRPSGRTEGGFRLYTEADLERLVLVRRMKPLGFSLEEMAEVLAVVDGLSGADPATGEHDDLRERLAAFVAVAQERRAAMARQLAMADELIEVLRAQA